MNIDISTYLSEDEQKQIARDAFFDACRDHFRDEKSVTRILSNMSFYHIREIVDDIIPDYEDKIAKGVVAALSQSDISYQIFRAKSAWEKEDSLAVTIMRQTINENADILEKRVVDLLSASDFVDQKVADIVQEKLEEAICNVYDLIGMLKK